MTIKNTKKNINMIASIVLGLLTISGFLLQIILNSTNSTKLEVGLFNLIQFILTIGFTWFSSQLINEGQLMNKLKDFAIGAFRRVSDIEIIVFRLKRKLNFSIEANKDLNNEIVSEIVEDLNLLINSSKADWSDIIGDEIDTIEEIKSLEKKRIEKEYSEKVSDNQADEIKNLEDKIAELRAKLPKDLEISSRISTQTRLQESHAASWLLEEHAKNEGLVVEIFAVARESDLEIIQSLNDKSELITKDSQFKGISVFEGDNYVGQILNCSPLSYYEFEKAFYRAFGSSNVKLQFLEKTGESKHKDKDDRIWYKAKLISTAKKKTTPNKL